MAKVKVTFYEETNYAKDSQGKYTEATTTQKVETFHDVMNQASVEGGFFHIVTETGAHYLSDVQRVDVEDNEETN